MHCRPCFWIIYFLIKTSRKPIISFKTGAEVSLIKLCLEVNPNFLQAHIRETTMHEDLEYVELLLMTMETLGDEAGPWNRTPEKLE